MQHADNYTEINRDIQAEFLNILKFTQLGNEKIKASRLVFEYEQLLVSSGHIEPSK